MEPLKPLHRVRTSKGSLPSTNEISVHGTREVEKLIFAQDYAQKKKKKLPHDMEKLNPVPYASTKSKFISPLGCRNSKPRN